MFQHMLLLLSVFTNLLLKAQGFLRNKKQGLSYQIEWSQYSALEYGAKIGLTLNGPFNLCCFT